MSRRRRCHNWQRLRVYHTAPSCRFNLSFEAAASKNRGDSGQYYNQTLSSRQGRHRRVSRRCEPPAKLFCTSLHTHPQHATRLRIFNVHDPWATNWEVCVSFLFARDILDHWHGMGFEKACPLQSIINALCRSQKARRMYMHMRVTSVHMFGLSD